MNFRTSCFFSLAFLLAVGAQTVTAAESSNAAVTSAVTSSVAVLASPTPSSKLTGSSATFSWTAGSGVSNYKLILGTSAGGSDVYNSYTTTANSKTVSGIPTNGATLYATLYSEIGSTWSSNAYTYTEYGTLVPTKATLTTPTPSSTLTGSSATFGWSAGSGVSAYKLTLGTTAGGSDVYNSYTTTATSKAVTGIPTSGATLYATLYSEIGSTWSSNAYTYTEYKSGGASTKATLTSPTPSSTLTGSSATFGWSVGSGVSAYKLTLGTTAGASDVYNSYTTTATSKAVTGIPTSGGTLYATLYSEIGGAWSSNAYTYTESGGGTTPAFTTTATATPSTVTIGASTTITIAATNTSGVALSDGIVLLNVYAKGTSTLAGTYRFYSANIAAGQTQPFTFVWTPASTITVGDYTVTVGIYSTNWGTMYYWNTDSTITVVANPIVPYLQVNSGSWQQTNIATVASGATVNLGPQPISGGSWSWTGPNSFTSTLREIDNIALPSTTNTYTASYTGTNGATSTQVFVITVGTATLPCDIYASGGTPCVAAHSSTRALFASYDGPLYQVIRASDSTTLDVGLLAAGGYANIAPQDTFCSGTYCTVTKIYDQSSYKNDLTIAPAGGAVGTADNGVPANGLPMQAGGHQVYGLSFTGGMGYRIDISTGVAKNGEPEGAYMVTSGTHVNGGCCFDYGNAEANNDDTGNGHMDAINFGTECWFTPCYGSGPWVQADMENGLFQSNDGYSLNSSNTGWPQPFVTAWLKNNGSSEFALRAGNAQSGGLTTEYDGGESYASWYQEGSVLLGIGGDNSNSSVGSFFEGAMTYGYPTDAIENAVQANIVSVGYDTTTSTKGTLTANSEISIQLTTSGYTGYYLRHQASNNTQVVVASSLSSSSAISDLADATWVVRSGLADANCYSFEARDRPGEFIRHSAFILYSQPYDGSSGNAQDATFCAVTGNSGSGVSFQSKNYPTKYIRHYDLSGYIAADGGSNAWDTTTTWAQDSTFTVVNPLNP